MISGTGKPRKLTDNAKRFCDEYVIDLDPVRAYMAAYPRVKSKGAASTNASRLLADDRAKAYIAEQMEKINDEKIAKRDEVLKYLTAVMRGETEAYEIVTEMVGDGMSKAKEMKKKPYEKDKLKAAELLGKRYGLFNEKISIDGNVPVVISGEAALED